jgi:hypothetical protein
MKKCIIISNYIVNQYRESILKQKISFFNSLGIDVFLVSSTHIKKYEGVDHYLTLTVKNCYDKYLSTNLHLYVTTNDNKNFWYKFPNSNSQHNFETYFLKMFQITINQCHLLGYDFIFFMEFDMLFHENTFLNNIYNNIDYTKYYFYKVFDRPDDTSYHSIFFYGNTKDLTQLFSTKNLNLLSNLSKNENVWSVEHAVWLMLNRNEFDMDKSNLVLRTYLENDFYTPNLFSSNNIVDVFYDFSNKKHYFLHSKNFHDSNKSQIGAEVFLDNTLVYSNSFKSDGAYSYFELQNNRNYTIKNYDGDICEERLYNVKQIYTDPDVPATKYYCTNN